MLLLCSDGLTSEYLLDTVKENLRNGKKAALVVTADHEYKEDNLNIPRCKKELQSLGLIVDCFDLDKQPAELLLDYDVVELMGGNPFYLLSSIRKNKAEAILKQIFKEKILIGWSAGAMVLGCSLELMNKIDPEMNFIKLRDLKGLELAILDILPHYENFEKKYKNLETVCQAYEKRLWHPLIRLDDGEGIAIEDSTFVDESEEDNW